MLCVLAACALCERFCVCRAPGGARLCGNTGKCRGFGKEEVIGFEDIREKIGRSRERVLELAVYGSSRSEPLCLDFLNASFEVVRVRGLRKREFVRFGAPGSEMAVYLSRIQAVSNVGEWRVRALELESSRVVTESGEDVRVVREEKAVLLEEEEPMFYEGVSVIRIGKTVEIDTKSQTGIVISASEIRTDSSSIEIVATANLERAVTVSVTSETVDILSNASSEYFLNLLTINVTGSAVVNSVSGLDLPNFNVVSSNTTYYYNLEDADANVFSTLENTRFRAYTEGGPVIRRLDLTETDTVVVKIASPSVTISFSDLMGLSYRVIFHLESQKEVQCRITDYSQMQPDRKVTITTVGAILIVRDSTSSVILEDIIDLQPGGSITYDPVYSLNLCLCPNTRLKQCKESRYCRLYDVPDENYYASRSAEFFTKISASRIDLINVYVTSFSVTEIDTYHKVDFVAVEGEPKTINFISVDPTADTKTKFYFPEDSAKLGLKIAVLDLSFLKIMNFGQNLVVPYLQLTGTLLHVEDNEIVSVGEMITDMYSLASLDGRLDIAQSLTFVSSTVYSIDGVTMKDGSKLVIDRIALLPSIHVEQKAILFTNGNDDVVVGYPATGSCSVVIKEMTTDNPSIIINGMAPQSSTIEGLGEIIFSMENSLNVTINNVQSTFGDQLNFSVLAFPNVQTPTLSLAIVNGNDDGAFFRSITGNIDLYLETFETFVYVAKHIIAKDLEISDIKGLSINFEELAKEISFGDNAMTIKSVADQSVYFQYGSFENDKFEIRTSRQHLLIDLAEEEIDLEHVPRLSIVLDDTGWIEFGTKFVETPEAYGVLSIDHGSRNVFLSTGAKAVPLLNLDDPIVGVLYEAGTDYYEVSSKTDWKTFNGRSGPNLTVKVLDMVTVPQSAFLAERVAFLVGDFKFLMEYINKSATTYVFENMAVEFVVRPSMSARVTPNVTMTGLFLRECEMMAEGGGSVNLEVDRLDSDVQSIAAFRFGFEPIVITEQFVTDDTAITTVIVNNDGIELVSPQYNSSRLMRKEGTIPEFAVNVTTERRVTVTAAGSDIVGVIIYVLANATLVFDRTWYHVTNSALATVHIVDDAHAILETELLNMPPITVIGSTDSYLIRLNEPRYTAGTVFITFGFILLLVIIVCVILTIIGYHCLHAEVTLDISDSSADIPSKEVKAPTGNYKEAPSESRSKELIEETNSFREYNRPIEESSS